MAKAKEPKKKAPSTAPALPYSTAAGASVESMFGEGIIINGTHVVEHPPQIISLSPKLDDALGGGLQVGAIVILGGAPRCGKTTTALHFAGKWQAMGRKVVYVNAEHRLHSRDLTGIPGLRPQDFEVIQSRKGRILSTQDYLVAIEKYLTTETDTLVIVDSFSIMCEEKEMTGDYDTEIRGGSGKIIAKFCRRMAPVIPTNDNMVLGIIHVYANPTGYGRPFTEAISSKLNFGLSTKMFAQKYDMWYENPKEKEGLLGQTVNWKIERSPLGPPNAEVVSYLRYGRGIDEVQESIEIAQGLNLIEKSGSWLYLNFLPDKPSVQGAGQLYRRIDENPEEFAALLAAIKEMVT